ncbi:MAG: polyphosphate polymerase domain-containing protein [Clostridiales bacterium]|nr:polyphosphate polymerase domain-containing protein [Clostridiales bacterium]
MSYLNTFKRYEIKYILDAPERKELCDLMKDHMKLDKYGKTTIRNIYYDTDDYRIIRRSLEKPEYKEKLRVRSYSRVRPYDDVFVELKKKYESVVYKRRVALPEYLVNEWLTGGEMIGSSQIENEIDYFKDFYEGISPKVFISYEREAYYPLDDTDIRVTLDGNIVARDTDLTLEKGVYGENILPRDLTVLEVKVPCTMPLWLVDFLSERNIRKTSFSKYGSYYQNKITKENSTLKGGLLYA